MFLLVAKVMDDAATAWSFSLDALLAIVGAAVALAGFLAALVIYLAQRVGTKRRDAESARALLLAARNGTPWADTYFTTDYTGDAGDAQRQSHYDTVMQGSWSRIYPVPTEPLAAVLGSPAAGTGIERDTLTAVGVALWKISLFNDLVRQQTDFATLHLAEIRDANLAPDRRQVLAEAAGALSLLLHRDGIGNPTWYADFKRAIDCNIARLGRAGKTRSPF